jgi:hypothetical protein
MDEGKNDPDNKLIPVKELVPLLSDLYVSDGVLAFPPVKTGFSKKDSISNYIDVITSHGFTKKRVDYTLHYYFVNNPEKLKTIYDQVLANLSSMQSNLESLSPPEDKQEFNLWNLSTSFFVPEEGIHNSCRFNIAIRDTGYYLLSFDAILYNDDKSLNPRVTVWFWGSDETEEGKSVYWDQTELIRDGIRHNYILKARLTDTSLTHIRGLLFNHDPQPARWEKHARFSNIVLSKSAIE